MLRIKLQPRPIVRFNTFNTSAFDKTATVLSDIPEEATGSGTVLI
nr:hypothetical protein [Endozoicomonas sp.]